MIDAVDTIVACMHPPADGRDVQRIQTAHRMRLTEFWRVEAGARLLEIGCGQGDTTAVLAYAVGPTGHVHGVDAAAPDYGAPVAIGEAAQRLLTSALGQQIRIDFGFNVLAPEVSFGPRHFDGVVLSHCSWYLKSPDELLAILRRVRPWATHLYFAEWDPRVRTLEQLPHLMAAVTQAQVECFKDASQSNIRTLFTPDDIREIATAAGWDVQRETSIRSPDMQDGRWETEHTLQHYPTELPHLRALSPKFAALVQSQLGLLQDAVARFPVQPLGTWAFVAK
jgi:SAM-dependent methyltransferase